MNVGLGLSRTGDKVSMLGRAIGARLQRKQQDLDQQQDALQEPPESTTVHCVRARGPQQPPPQEPLCILNCCGRGKLHILWVDSSAEAGAGTWSSPHSPYAQSVDAEQGTCPAPFPPSLPATSREGDGAQGFDDPTADSSTDCNGTGSEPEKLGRLQFSISHDFHAMTLTLKIIRAVDLAAKDFTGTSDPYVKVMLLPDKKNKLTTNIKRRNLNPRWNEVFAFEGFPYAKLMSRTLYLQVLDYDRFSRDDPIGEVCVPLSDLDLTVEQTLWRTLQPCKGHTGKLGELHVTLCYQPTAECIYVIIGKARGLKAKDINGLSDPYVKIWLLRDGKRIEKRKSAVHEKCLNPSFDETFMFLVPCEFIRQTSLAVSVMDYDKMGRNERIGQVILGTKSGPIEVKHWNEMFAKTRQNVARWHILKDFG